MTVIPPNVDLSGLGAYNVKAFGAVGDGVTDDSPPIQAAINAAYVAGGGIVYLPGARYLLDGGSITRHQTPGDPSVRCNGLAPAPPGFVFASATNYFGPNCPAGLAHPLPAAPGTLPAGMLPNGPLLLFDNVILTGDGPEQTILLAGENLYGGWMFSPTGDPTIGAAWAQSGVVIATPNWWADYASDLTHFPDGFYAKGVYVMNLSIDCQGKLGVNAGLPSHLLTVPGNNIIANTKIQIAFDQKTPIGTLYGSVIDLHAAQNCGVDNVWVYDGNLNGILVEGTLSHDAFEDGPLPQSFQQTSGGLSTFSPNTVAAPNPSQPPGINLKANVPVVNGWVTRSQVDLNYPVWLAGSPKATGGSDGRLPIRVTGCAAVVVALNRVGQRNQPSNFPPPQVPSTSNPPNVSCNTNDAMDCTGTWHVLIFGNLLSNCGDGVGADGNGDLIVACNVMYNFGSVGFLSLSTTHKASSQTLFVGNTIFLGSDFENLQAISIQDEFPPEKPNQQQAMTATPGSVVIADNIIYGSYSDAVMFLGVVGAVVKGNVFDFGGVQPPNQPNPSGILNGPGTPNPPVWPTPNCTGITVAGTDIVIEGNIFRNAASPAMPNPKVFGIKWVVPGGIDAVRVLVKGNLFDKTIGTPIDPTNLPAGVRIIDNVGVNPVGALDPSLVGFPGSGATFSNPYPYDCFVTVSAGADAVVSAVALDGVVTGATIPSGDQASFVVTAGGSIALTYAGAPTWVWAGL